MSDEAPIPPVGKRKRTRIIKSNRVQIFLFVLLTLVLTVATVWGARIWLKNSETLVFAVGDPNGPEARFANRLATMLKNNYSRLRVRIVSNGDNAKALAQFDRQEANLAVLRTDAKVPPRARAVAILDHDVVLVFSKTPAGNWYKPVKAGTSSCFTYWWLFLFPSSTLLTHLNIGYYVPCLYLC